METTIVYPRESRLANLIQYFLFIENDDPHYDRDHVSFPNTNHCLGLHQGNRLTSTSEATYQIESSKDNHSFLTGIYRQPIKIRSAGVFNQVCINFEPGGLEQLTNQQLSNQVFFPNVIRTRLQQAWMGIFDAAFSDEDPIGRARNVEQFLLDFDCCPDLPVLDLNRLKTKRVSDLPAVMDMSYRSVHRFFHNFLSLPPKEFLNIVRFRQAIKLLHSSRPQIKAAVESGYSDQSHMIRMFYKYANRSPRAFLAQSSMVANEMCWSIQ